MAFREVMHELSELGTWQRYCEIHYSGFILSLATSFKVTQIKGDN